MESSPANADVERNLALSETIEMKKKLVDEIATTSPTSKGQNAVTTEKQTVILTGSTGAFGSYLLLDLIDNPSVSHIYCLNRGPDSQQSQIKRNKTRGLPIDFPSDRVTFLSGNPTKPNFGLDPKTYAQMFQTTTKIIHNAWAVSLTVPLSAFEEQIDGVIAFAKFAYDSPTHPTFHFISSTSAVRGLSDASVKIPEVVIKDISATAAMGYAQSKYVSEVVLDYAAEKLLIDARISRLGHIGGPAVRAGFANADDWFTNLAVSSVAVGAVPASMEGNFDNMDWMAADVLADVVVGLTFDERKARGGNAVVYHPQNPQVQIWQDYVPKAVQKYASSLGKECEVVALKEWLKRVAEDAEACGLKGEELDKRSPGVKFLPVYELFSYQKLLPKFDLTKTLEASEKLRNVEGIKPEWIENWCKAWMAQF